MGKKSKSTPKSKPKPVVEEEPRNQQPEEKKKISCSSCRQTIKPNTKPLQCIQCKKMAHLECYSPKNTEKKFVCDMCQHSRRKITCYICKKYDKSQMLKFGGENMYFHIDCALLNSQAQIESYEKLKISIKKGGQKDAGTCTFCQKQEANILKCLFCEQTSHYKCVSEEIQSAQKNSEIADYYFTFRWLDKNQKQNYLLSYICSKRNSSLKELINVQNPKKIRQLIICPHHSDTKQFSWCPCDEPEKNNETPGHQSIYCDECDRCIHRECITKKKVKDFTCQGCKKNELFKKQVKINEQIKEAAKIQVMENWGKKQFRFLNSFAFQYSEVLEARIEEHLKQIQLYFIEKDLQLWKDKKIPVQGIENTKNFKVVMYYILQETDEVYKKRLDNPNLIQEIVSRIKESEFLKKLEIPLILDKVIEHLHELGQGIKINENARIVIEKLGIFNDQCKIRYPQNSDSSQITRVAVLIKQIANQLGEVMGSESKLKAKFKLFKEGNSIFKILIKNKLSLSMIETILKHYKILKQCMQDDNYMNEDDYTMLLSGNYGDNTEQQKFVANTIYNYFKEILNKQIKLKYKAVEKENEWKKIANKLKSKFHNNEEIRKHQNDLISKRICFGGGEDKDNVLNNLNMSRMEFNILKKKYLSYAKEAQRSLTDKHVKIFAKLNEFKYNNAFLRPDEVRILHKFSIKIMFHLQIVKKGKMLLVNHLEESEELQNFHGMNEDMNGRMIEEEQEIIEKQEIIKNLHKVIENWHSHIISTEFMLGNLGILANESIQFNTNCERRKLKDLAIRVLNARREQQQLGNLMKGKEIRNAKKIIQYLKIDGQFLEMQEKYERYMKWGELLNVKGNQVYSILQKLQPTQNLMKNIEILLGSSSQLNLNLAQEINKLCTIRQWCKISEKLLSCKRKPSINAINYLKILSDKTRYPNNSVKISLISLDSQGKVLNKQILKFLQKPKVQDFMEIYDELRFIQNKINHQEALSMKNAFEDAQLDISAEIQELQSELKEFEELPSDFSEVIERGNFKELISLRQKILNLAIKPERIDQYEKLLRKIYEIKCINFSAPITRKQYFQLLSLGGEASIYLMERTQNLFKAYKLIEKAENELLTNSIRKRNFSNLISMDEKKIKEIKEDLRTDPIEVNNFQKARLYVMRLKENYHRYRRDRAEIERYSQLEDELLTTIFNTKDIINQISMIKRQFNETCKRVIDAVQYGETDMEGDESYENILTFARDGKNYYLQRYLHSGIKHSLMEIFWQDCKTYTDFEEAFQNQELHNYRKFSFICYKFSDWAKRIDTIIQKRERFFAKVYQFVKENDEQPQIQLCRALIEQGVSLRMFTSKKSQYLNCVFQMNQRVKKYGPSEDDPLQDSEEDEIGISNEDDDGFEDSEDDDEGGRMDEDDSDREMGAKRPRDNNQIVLDDDDSE